MLIERFILSEAHNVLLIAKFILSAVDNASRIDSMQHKQPSVDVISWRLKSIPAL